MFGCFEISEVGDGVPGGGALQSSFFAGRVDYRFAFISDMKLWFYWTSV